MNDEKNKTTAPAENPVNENEGNEELHVKNPFNENDDKIITKEDVESEQEFKEAQTERD